MLLSDIGTISPSGRKTVAYTLANGTAQVEVPDDHPNPDHAAKRALMLYLAADEWKAGETIAQARARMRDYLTECPPVSIGKGRDIETGLETIIYREGERE